MRRIRGGIKTADLLIRILLVCLMLFVYRSWASAECFPSQAGSVSLKLHDTDVRDALRMVSSELRLNIILAESVTGKVSLNFDNVDARQAFEAILKTSNLVYNCSDGIIRIDTARNAEQDEMRKATHQSQIRELEQKAKAAEQARKESEKNLVPLVTKTVRLKYIFSKPSDKYGKSTEAKLDNFEKVLRELLSDRKDANLEIIEKTNTLVVTDIGENVDKIITMARQLDVPTPQIKIEARVVEIRNSDKLELGIQWGGKFQDKSFRAQGTKLSTGTGIDPSATPLAVNTPAGVGAGSGGVLGMIFGHVSDNKFLDVELSALEKAEKAEVISKPSIMVMQNQNAEIHVGSEVPILKGFVTGTSSGTSGGNLPFPEVEYKKIGILLNITPQVTSEESIFMVVSVEKSTKGDQFTIQGQPYDTIDTKNASTQVVVRNGETLVIGGLYTKSEDKTKNGLPYLSKLPYIGWLFGVNKDAADNQELMIFITPEIVSPAQTAS